MPAPDPFLLAIVDSFFMFSGISAENMKKNRLCVLRAFAVNIYLYNEETVSPPLATSAPLGQEFEESFA